MFLPQFLMHTTPKIWFPSNPHILKHQLVLCNVKWCFFNFKNLFCHCLWINLDEKKMMRFTIVSFFSQMSYYHNKNEKKFFLRTCLLLLTWAPSHLYSCSFSQPQKFFHHNSMPPLELLTILVSTTNHKSSHNKKSQSNCPTQCKTTPCLFDKQVCVLYLSKLHFFLKSLCIC
jgi:hypothetical protein